MGHDISGHNNSGDQIAYARFSMGNYNAAILYNLLDSDDYNGGVSGTGDISTFSAQQIKSALYAFKQFCGNPSLLNNSFLVSDQEQIQSFLLKCLETAEREGSVIVFFG